jgi:hypothetical protein
MAESDPSFAQAGDDVAWAGRLADQPAGPFDIAFDFVGAWTSPLQAAFLSAAHLIESVVVGDLPDILVPAYGGVPGGVVDDLVIQAELPAIDGAGGVLGESGPVLIRADGLLPATASMRFDVADAVALQADGSWGDVVLHEMLHAMGFGTLWAMKGLAAPTGAGGNTGAAGMAEYAATGGSGPVPVETGGGPGTAGEHWSEAVFGDELMTGWIGGQTHLSLLTIASLADLGYVLAPREQWAADAALA